MFLDNAVEKKRIHYIKRGKGKPILFVHGWGGSSRSLFPLAKLFSRTHTTIVIDLPGFGKSDIPEKNWGVPEYSRLILLFMKKIGYKTFDYFGHSFGGSLGIYLASHEPGSIRKLILCASSFKRTKQKNSVFHFINYLPLPHGILIAIKKIGYRIFYPHSDSMKYPFLETNFRNIISYDLTSYLRKINNNTYIFWGEEDTETPVSLAHELHKKIKNTHLFVYKNQGHSLPLISPQLIYKQLIKHL